MKCLFLVEEIVASHHVFMMFFFIATSTVKFFQTHQTTVLLGLVGPIPKNHPKFGFEHEITHP